MSLSSILQQVQRKGQIPARNEEKKPKPTALNPVKRTDHGRSDRVRVVDPVVARLKAARKLEMEKKEQERRAKMGSKGTSNANGSKKLKSTIPMRGPVKKLQQGNQQPLSGNNSKAKQPQGAVRNLFDTAAPRRPPAKKMKFNELMKKASKIDNSKLSINIKHRTTSPETKEARLGRGSQPKGVNYASLAPPRISAPKREQVPRDTHREAERRERVVHSNPLPVRKPSSVLEQKLSSKKAASTASSRYRDEYEDESDNDSFIASEDEEEYESRGHGDYDRDEIWAIFNRGKKRSHFEVDGYDSADDMEATGAEILEEEMRSKRRAEIEDKKEWEEEQRLAAAKRARKLGR